MHLPRRRRRLLIPEVIQTSGMDCGPAALKALLDGFHIQVGYGRLREACHTQSDGTSIDTLEEVARQLRLDAEQIMLPADHLLLPAAEALPAVVVVRNPQGSAHFIVVWRIHGPFVQTMDPARGRVWVTRKAFLDRLINHTAVVSGDAWREWAGSYPFLMTLAARMRVVGLSQSEANRHIATAARDESWRALGTLDAAVRMISSLRSANAVSKSVAARALDGLVSEANIDPSVIPDHCWSVRRAPAATPGLEQLYLRGAVLVRARPIERKHSPNSAATGAPASPELAAALNELPVRPVREVFKTLRRDGLLNPVVAVAAAAIVVIGIVFEAVLLRSTLDLGTLLRGPGQILTAGAALVVFASALLGLELLLASAERRAGSQLEGRLRVAFFTKIPRLADAYFQSRPISDMIERSHTVHTLRVLPRLAVRLFRVALELGVTALAIAWINPSAALIAVAAATTVACVPLFAQPVIAERDLRVRTHTGALARFHLDALLGRTALEAHGAAPAIEQEHESLLSEWTHAFHALQRASIGVEGFQMMAGVALVAWMVFTRMGSADAGGLLLLQMYWMLNLPALGYELALIAREYPTHRSTLLRLFEPLTAPEDKVDEVSESKRSDDLRDGISISARNITIQVGGVRVLDALSCEIGAGAQVAIVGASGAGKSTLAGILLGWHRPVSGEILVNGEPLTGDRIERLRERTAWVDPTVRLWNRSLLENVLYGSNRPDAVGSVLESAGLLPVVAKLPQGLATPLGEGGALLSAGEAQRVRLARAMLREGADLVVLDEPFLGLERDRRTALLANARQHWRGATLLYVTHDITETRTFDHVLVVDSGRIVEQGEPARLAQIASSKYRRLLQIQESMLTRFASSAEWQRIRIESGRLVTDKSIHVSQLA